MAYLAERHRLLPDQHFGGRQGRSVDESVGCFVSEIKKRWREGQVVVGIALDVAKAFPSVDTDAMCASLAGRGLPANAVRWVRPFMEERSCDLRLEGISSGPLEWQSGLPQGSPLSPILYLFYNAPALAALQTPTSTAFGWIDDINLLVWGQSVSKAVERVNALMPRLESWATAHHSAFEPSKSDVVLYIPHNKKVSADRPNVTLAGSTIPWAPSLTMLGAVIDERLTFEKHVAACASKASTALAGIRLLTNAKGHLRRRFAIQLVRAIVWPRLDWCAAAWFEPSRNDEVESLKKVRVAAAVHREALVLATGAYRSAAVDAMEVEANLLPLRLRLRAAVARLVLRAASAPESNPLAKRLRQAQADPFPPHPSPLHHGLAALAGTVPPLHRLETIFPHATAPWTPPPGNLIVQVAGTKDDAVAEHTAALSCLDDGDLVVYSDGSLMDGVAGAGAAF